MGILARLVAVFLVALAAITAPATAQNLFETVATVDDRQINRFQVEQRARFFALLRAPNADFEGARDVLIDESLQVDAARRAGIEVTPEALDEAMVEFAARANLTPDQFVQALEANGVSPETFRDFIRNGLYWRQLVQGRFGPRARPNEAEIERALAQGNSATGIRVLLSEIAIPLTPENQDEVTALARQLSQNLSGQDAFQRAARQYSRAPSAQRGGRLDWLPLSQLAPPIAAQVLALGPGQVTEPINLGSFIGIYLLRDLDEGQLAVPDTLSIDYAEYRIPGGRSEEALSQAARIRERIDTCDDLYGIAKGQPEGTLLREVRAVGELPDDLRQSLATLDPDETTTLLSGNGVLRLVMLCGRVTEQPEGAFEQIGQQLLNQRLVSYAQGYLEELRADAVIEIR
ncbi:peptidylprolyl isomerase [Jannaschia aquimarina]|uniref:Parvulin-like PPIase n=1 Tax=Jannaschia aquimarina TaxID=935700 RepID=A0A0D1EJV9_9RHOB|nr:peptidylprolyl isomerase [Jannaschia aquimarina]KIT17839.1 Chaperone SurA precursor [Jannaschia aquimarina]SNS90303.1 periplasmic chaperone for outer membrane proteins SurA [Jannaschia aquimarina]